MSDELAKSGVATVRVAKRQSTTTARIVTYRVSKAQSLRMQAHDRKVEAAEALKAKKLAETQKPKVE